MSLSPTARKWVRSVVDFGGLAAFLVAFFYLKSTGMPQQQALVRLADIPLTQGGKDTAHVENMLAAVAVAWALDVSLDVMRTGVETFFIE